MGNEDKPGPDRAVAGRLTDDQPDYGDLYSSQCQGDFYGADYYKPPASDIESAIIYDDNEDKRLTAAMLVAAFGPRRALEAGCATGLLVKAMRGSGVDAWGFDFSKWCVENAHPAVKDRVVWGDILDLGKFTGGPPGDLALTLDILEHLPPDRVPAALANLTDLMAPGAILFAVIPAYGPNAFGPELYPLKYEGWRRDAAAGLPFRNIPLDDQGRPHLGHLTHAAIDWWEETMRAAGLERLGEVERLLHQLFDERLEFARRSFFVFTWKGHGPGAEKAVAGCVPQREIRRFISLFSGLSSWRPTRSAGSRSAFSSGSPRSPACPEVSTSGSSGAIAGFAGPAGKPGTSSKPAAGRSFGSRPSATIRISPRGLFK